MLCSGLSILFCFLNHGIAKEMGRLRSLFGNLLNVSLSKSGSFRCYCHSLTARLELTVSFPHPLLLPSFFLLLSSFFFLLSSFFLLPPISFVCKLFIVRRILLSKTHTSPALLFPLREIRDRSHFYRKRSTAAIRRALIHSKRHWTFPSLRV